MPDPSDKRSVTVHFRPIDCFFLGFESAEFIVRMVFDYIIVNGRPFRATLRTSFDVNVRHSLLSSDTSRQHLKLYETKDCLIAPSDDILLPSPTFARIRPRRRRQCAGPPN